MINKYTKNLLITSFPGFFSILLSFFSIPIYLKFLGYEDYGNYLILHILLSISMITNLNLGKIASVRMQKVNFFQSSKIISTTIALSFFSSAIICLILFLIIKYFSNFYNLKILNNNVFFFSSLFLTNLYVTLENLCKGKKFFKLSSISNFIFYSLSISIPCLVFTLEIDGYVTAADLFKISFFLKITGVLVLILSLFSKNLIRFGVFSKIIINDFKIYVKWQTLSSTYMQIFDFLDKYIIKIVLGSASLSIYSIPQQIAGKLSIISDSLISVFLPRISSKQSKNERFKILNSNFYGFFYFVGLPILLAIPFLDNLILWWLGNSANIQIIYLFKIFLLVAFYVCLTQILSIFYDTIYQSKINSNIDALIMVFFIIGIFFSMKSGNLYYFAYTVLIKSILAFILKLNFIKKYILQIRILILQNLIFIMTFIFEIFQFTYFYLFSCFLFLLLLIKMSPISFLKKEFFK